MRRYVLFLCIFAAIGVAGPATLAQAPQAPVTVIRAGKLIDPATGQVTTNQSIVVTGNRITSVGATAEVHPGAAVHRSLPIDRHARRDGHAHAHVHGRRAGARLR